MFASEHILLEDFTYLMVIIVTYMLSSESARAIPVIVTDKVKFSGKQRRHKIVEITAPWWKNAGSNDTVPCSFSAYFVVHDKSPFRKKRQYDDRIWNDKDIAYCLALDSVLR